MHNTFSIQRFGVLSSTYFKENARKLSLQILALFAGQVVLFLLLGLFNSLSINEGVQLGIYYIGLYFCSYLFTASSLAPYAKGAEASYLLLQPASTFEKLLLHWLTTALGFFVVYQCCYFICRKLIIELVSIWEPGIPQTYYEILPLDIHSEKFDMSIFFFIFYTIVHSIALLGSISFPKYTLLLTLLTIIVTLSLLIGWQIYWYENNRFLGSSGFLGLPFTNIKAHVFDTIRRPILIQFPLHPWLGILCLLTVQFLINLATYYKLKEKQV